MADPRFYRRAGPFRLGDLAQRLGVALSEAANPQQEIHDVGPLDTAGAETLTFLETKRHLPHLKASMAGACLLHPDLAPQAPPGLALLLSPNPYRTFAQAAFLFYPPAVVEPGIAASAVIDPTAQVAPDARIEAGAVIGPGAEIGAGSVIGPNTVVGAGVVIGAGCHIAANVTLSHCLIGDRVVIHPGCCLGQDGFGYVPGATGHQKVPQLGRVIVDADVELGANTTLDRGAMGDTVIGAGSKIDNLVQIGHNVTLGPGCLVASQVGISGSTHLGRLVMVGGQTGFADHLTIGDGVQIAAQSGLMRDVAAGETVMGSPAKPIKDYMREVATLKTLATRKPSTDKKNKGSSE